MLASTSWGASAACLRTTALAMVFSTAEHCCSTWLNSAHVNKVNVELNKAMRKISGTVASTPLQWLPALSQIAPAENRRRQALLRDYRNVINNPNIPLRQDLMLPPVKRLKSRKPATVTAKHLHEDGFDIREEWKIGWLETSTESPLFDFDSHTSNSGEFTLPRKIWCNLNRLRTGHGRCNEMLQKWNQTDDPSCECGEPHQTTDHILFDCPKLSYQGNIEDLRNLHPDALQWLKDLKL